MDAHSKIAEDRADDCRKALREHLQAHHSTMQMFPDDHLAGFHLGFFTGWNARPTERAANPEAAQPDDPTSPLAFEENGKRYVRVTTSGAKRTDADAAQPDGLPGDWNGCIIISRGDDGVFRDANDNVWLPERESGEDQSRGESV